MICFYPFNFSFICAYNTCIAYHCFIKDFFKISKSGRIGSLVVKFAYATI